MGPPQRQFVTGTLLAPPRLRLSRSPRYGPFVRLPAGVTPSRCYNPLYSAGRFDQAKVSLIDQRRGLERVGRLLIPHVPACDEAQFAINMSCQPVQRSLVASVQAFNKPVTSAD